MKRTGKLAAMAALGFALSGTLLAAATACNTGIFAEPTNAGATVCECTCDATLTPDAGNVCVSTCEAPFQSAEQIARAEGCADPFAAYTSCLVDEGSCTDRSFDAPGCGEQQAALEKCQAGGQPGG